MKLSISEARKRLPELVRRVRKDAGAKIEITVHDEDASLAQAPAAEKRMYPVMSRNSSMVPPPRIVDGAAASPVL